MLEIIVSSEEANSFSSLCKQHWNLCKSDRDPALFTFSLFQGKIDLKSLCNTYEV